MQIALKRTPFLQIGQRKRRLLRFAVTKVLGNPSHWKQGNTRWFVFSDPSIDWHDVRRLIACVELVADLPDVEPPTNRDEARQFVKDWARPLLTDWPADDLTKGPGQTSLTEWFGRTWLRFNTKGMHRIMPDGSEIPNG